MVKPIEPSNYSRRDALSLVTRVAAGVIAAGLSSSISRADEKLLAEAIARAIGDATPKVGRVKLHTPELAENGNSVPVSVRVDSRMTEADFVESLHLFTEKNPEADVAGIYFSESCASANVSLRMRLGESQNIIAIARMRDNSVFAGKNYVKVTIGGCGG